MMTSSKQILLKHQCSGVPTAFDFMQNTVELPQAKEGDLICETRYLSLDPYLRGKISGRHMSGSIQPGELMAGEAISEVIESQHPDYKAGDFIAAHSGWQTHSVIAADGVRKLDSELAPLSTFLGILGMPGLTAYAGLLRLGQPKAGDTVLVSAASGPVGSMVAQLAKLKGCRSIGIAGSPEKCAWFKDVAGLDDCINYKLNDLREEIKRTCPSGIDVYFDNVGGDMLQAAMEHLALNARVVLCGLMAQYNTDTMPPGPNPAFIIKARATVRGMVVYDHEDLRDEMVREVSQYLRDGKIHYLEDMTEGLENAPEAFSRLMQGKNHGKAIVRVA